MSYQIFPLKRMNQIIQTHKSFYMYFNKKNFLITAAISLAGGPLMAQNAAPATEKTVTSGNNQLATLLVITTIVFAFVIWGLGQVLVAFTKQAIEKAKNNNSKIATIALITIFTLAAQSGFSQTTSAATDSVKVVPNYGGLTALEFYLLATVIVVEIVAILFLAFSIRRVYKELISPAAAAIQKKESWWSNMDKKVLTKAVPVEKEADVLLDHDYDGIHELDNALPPWWKYGFYFTIGVAFIYILNYHVFGSGKNPLQEYEEEMNKAKIAKEQYDSKNKDKIDETNIPMADAAGIAKGKEIFTTTCKPCHGAAGEGGVGPNLTDDYWIHKGSLNDVYQSIKHGYPDKGMPSWATQFSPKEMSLLASFVKSIHGTNPPSAKAPQGDLFTESASPKPAADSTKTPVADTVKVKK